MKLDQAAALARSQSSAASGDVDQGAALELSNGWFFPWLSDDRRDMAGSNGVIVHKATGRLLQLGSAFSVERDLKYFEKGYCYEQYDLVITRVNDIRGSISFLESLDLRVVEPEFENGTVWRMPRALTAKELRLRLDRLPAAFGPIRLYFDLEKIDAAQERGTCEFKVLGYTGGPSGIHG